MMAARLFRIRPWAAAGSLTMGSVLGFLVARGEARSAPQAGHNESSLVPPNAPIKRSITECIGNTPLLELTSLSKATGCRILAKAEHLNPGGSVKDRAALRIITEAEAEGRLLPGGTIVEGTGGNTGVAMALIAASRGYNAVFTMPDNTSREKVELMEAFGARAIVCPVLPFSAPEHYYHVAQRLAERTPGAVWGNQFEGRANMAAHYTTTGPEIWQQAGGRVDAIALAAGTGGTIGGLSTFLREMNPRLRVFLIDPPGSCLANYVNTGALTPSTGSTLVEGIGIGRLTSNFKAALPIDRAFVGSDQEAIDMAYHLLR